MCWQMSMNLAAGGAALCVAAPPLMCSRGAGIRARCHCSLLGQASGDCHAASSPAAGCALPCLLQITHDATQRHDLLLDVAAGCAITSVLVLV